jgi:hypothetical protein
LCHLLRLLDSLLVLELLDDLLWLVLLLELLRMLLLLLLLLLELLDCGTLLVLYPSGLEHQIAYIRLRCANGKSMLLRLDLRLHLSLNLSLHRRLEMCLRKRSHRMRWYQTTASQLSHLRCLSCLSCSRGSTGWGLHGQPCRRSSLSRQPELRRDVSPRSCIESVCGGKLCCCRRCRCRLRVWNSTRSGGDLTSMRNLLDLLSG